jgi:hypothetical protein
MAASGRIYTVSFQNVTISAAQDMILVKAGASNPIALLSVNIGQITGTSVANQRVRIQMLPATVTVGSGGGAATINKWIASDAAASATGRINDTSQATSGGTIVDLWDDQWNIVNGFLWVPPIPSRPPVIAVSAAVRVSLDSAPSSVVTNMSLTFEELG